MDLIEGGVAAYAWDDTRRRLHQGGPKQGERLREGSHVQPLRLEPGPIVIAFFFIRKKLKKILNSNLTPLTPLTPLEKKGKINLQI